MLDVAVDREVEGDVALGDMGHGLPLRHGTFDGAISISAVQWLCNADKTNNEPKRRLKRFFETLYGSLVRGGRAVLQVGGLPQGLAAGCWLCAGPRMSGHASVCLAVGATRVIQLHAGVGRQAGGQECAALRLLLTVICCAQPSHSFCHLLCSTFSQLLSMHSSMQQLRHSLNQAQHLFAARSPQPAPCPTWIPQPSQQHSSTIPSRALPAH
jgi:hypothetical protein